MSTFNINGNNNHVQIIVIDNSQQQLQPNGQQETPQVKQPSQPKEKKDKLPWYKFVWEILCFLIPYLPAFLNYFKEHPK